MGVNPNVTGSAVCSPVKLQLENRAGLGLDSRAEPKRRLTPWVKALCDVGVFSIR